MPASARLIPLLASALLGPLVAYASTPSAAPTGDCSKITAKAARKACQAQSAMPQPAAPVAPLGQAGIFDINYGPFSGVYTLLEDGRFSGIHLVRGELAGHPHGQLPADNSPGQLAPIAWANFIDDYQQVGKQETNPRFGRSLANNTLAVTIVGGFGTFSATQTAQKTYGPGDATTLYHHPLPAAALAGRYAGTLRSVGIARPQEKISDFTISADGHFDVSAADCRFSGQLVQYAATAVFEARAEATGASCKYTAPLLGLVTPLAVIDGKARLAFQLDTADDVQTAVFVVNKQ